MNLNEKRYEVIAYYPGSPFKTGQVLTLTTFDEKITMLFEVGYPTFTKEMFDLCPHLFREIDWYEKREIGDMPEYVKHENEIRKVIKYKIHSHLSEVAVTLEKPFAHYDTEYFLLDDCTPATLSDYEQFKKNEQ